MFKKITLLVFLSSLSLYALNIGDTVPQNIQQSLKLKPNKVYVIDFFASWCHSCEKELPLMSKLYTNNNINVIGINEDEKEYKGRKFVKNLSLSFPIFYDKNPKMINTFSPKGFPTLYFIKNGKVLDIVVGAKNHIDKVVIKKVRQCK